MQGPHSHVPHDGEDSVPRDHLRDALRGTVGVWQGCAWRVRFKTSPTGPFVMLWIESLWDLFDLEGKLKDP